MARPTKPGLDYYPMDVGFLRDKKIRLLLAEFGASSVIFVLYVLGKAYEGDGYFLSWDKDECLLAADALQKPPTYVNEVLQGCLSRSIFDKRVFQMFSVLTSTGIQRRYIRGCEKRSDISIFSEYCLLDVDNRKDVPASIRAKLFFSSISGENNSVISPGNPDKSPGNPQSKVKESKVKQSKVITSPDADWGFGDELESALSKWLSYKEEKLQPCTPIELSCLTDQVREQVKKHGDKAVANLILLCMSNGWQGIAWEKLEKQSGPSGHTWRGSGATPGRPSDIKADMDGMKKYLEQLKMEQEKETGNGEL